MLRILIVDDDPIFLQLLSEFLCDHNYSVNEAENGCVALEILSNNECIDLIICDINMPEFDGIELLTLLQDEYPHIPVMMLTAQEDVETAVKAIKLGAMNYVSKSQIIETLVSKIDETMTQHRQKIKKLWRFGHLVENMANNLSVKNDVRGNIYDEDSTQNPKKLIINTDSRVVYVNGNLLNLTETEFDILDYLIRANGKVLSYKEISLKIHGIQVSAVEARRRLSTHISNLRKKLEYAQLDDCILTRRSRGFYINPKYL